MAEFPEYLAGFVEAFKQTWPNEWPAVSQLPRDIALAHMIERSEGV